MHILKSTTAALLVAGAVLATAPSANAQYYRHHNRGGAVVTLDFGNIAFGYRDGYWDRGHHWHRWRNNDEWRRYRGYHGGHYNDWNHDRDRDMGWHHRH